jgi:hypothetical protein
MSLLDLPDEVLRHVAEYAGLAACFPLSSTCKSVRALFRMEEVRQVRTVFNTEVLSLDRIMRDCIDLTEGLIAAIRPCLQVHPTDRTFKVLHAVVDATPSFFNKCDRVHELQQEYGFLADYGDNFFAKYVGPRTFRGETLYQCESTLMVLLWLVNSFMFFSEQRTRGHLVRDIQECITATEQQVALLMEYRASVQPFFVQSVPSRVFNQ